jgi:multiple antibiotic resistance protein
VLAFFALVGEPFLRLLGITALAFQGSPMQLILAVIAVRTLCCYVAFLAAEPIDRLLGVTGNVVLTRLLGIVLAALAVQFVVDGVRAAAAG